MTRDQDLQYDDREWQIPDFEVVTFNKSRFSTALVIPVINEGPRIRRQLESIHRAKLPVDVIVADGGSTDGSLDHSFVNTNGVTSVLTKLGPGRLSAQLRMAYAWCIKSGYTGIVTIDGNGKDGIGAIVEMVAMLDSGYDYVQGSRYLNGGLAENTPLERTLANRLIHAPLLSLAGRHWYTDTTNGFRAYSVRYLMDKRVQPFRDIFNHYELLFYLTVRAGQIGMQVGHLPVVRRYPSGDAIPTKLDSFGKKLDVLRQTLAVAMGRFTPDI